MTETDIEALNSCEEEKPVTLSDGRKIGIRDVCTQCAFYTEDCGQLRDACGKYSLFVEIQDDN